MVIQIIINPNLFNHLYSMKQNNKIKDSKVEEIMSKNIISLNPKEPISRAIKIFEEHEIHHIPIVIMDKVVGIISQGDVLNFTGKHNRLDQVKTFVLGHSEVDTNTSVEEIMASRPITISPDATIKEAVEQLIQYRVNALPVVENSELKGIITTHDILRLITS